MTAASGLGGRQLDDEIAKQMQNVFGAMEVASLPYVRAVGLPVRHLGELYLAGGSGTTPWVKLRGNADRDDQARTVANSFNVSVRRKLKRENRCRTEQRCRQVSVGRELRACRDAAAAIAAVARAKRWCSAVDLNAVRAGGPE
jgi:hypothetical protein